MFAIITEVKHTTTYQVLLFYSYQTIDAPLEVAQHIRTLCEKFQLKGRAIVAEEGINITLEGRTSDTESFIDLFKQDKRFTHISIKKSEGNGHAFPRLSVKVRKEIVATGLTADEANPQIKTASRLSPDQLHQWFNERQDFCVVDMRNDYEFQSGHFKDSIQAGIATSREFPQVIEKLEPLKHKKVVTVCTGGVRCEKMSAYLMHKGFTDVYQLEDGIHGYLEKYKGPEYEGTLYTFDGRVTSDFDRQHNIIGTCRLCKAPSEKYVNCANDACHLHFIVCDGCRDMDGKAVCSDMCKSVYLATPHLLLSK